MKLVVYIVLGALVIGGMYYGGFRLQRWWHYKVGYEARVQTQVCSTIEEFAILNDLEIPESCK